MRPPLMYLLLWYVADLVGDGFAVHAMIGEGLLSKVKEVITHFIVMCNDEAYVTASKSLTCG